ncbi:MAG: VWA domain-containing protein [Candidatus Nanohaloarchaea archaeon]
MVGFENPQLLALLALTLPGLLFVFRADERYGRVVGLMHTALIALLVVAAASPFINVDQSTQEQQEIVVLKDSSTSAELMQNTELELGDVKVREKLVASGNSSGLRHGILRNLEPDTAYVVVSDFQSDTSLQGIAKKFQQKNSTMNALKTRMEREASVTIEGPGSTVPGARNSFDIKVHATRGKAPRPKVYLDGSRIPVDRSGNRTWSFTRSFPGQGSHTVRAEIGVNDSYDVNDRYYHGIEVTEKPRVLVLGEKGTLTGRLEKFYRVDHRSQLPEDLSPYYAIIMKKDPVQEPVNYVSRGNGVVYTGSYEREMDILPVKKIPERQQNRGAKIMLAIDISQGTEGGTAGMIKRIAYNLVEKLPYNNRVGAVAYNRDAYLVSSPKPLSQNREALKQKIASLSPSGPSFHNNGIKGARIPLEGVGNVILVTDGRTGGLASNRNVKAKTKRLADRLQVQLITVGVGENRDEKFLKEIADRGNGVYLDAQDSSKLQFRFESGGASGQTVPLVVVNPEHFITEGIELSSAATFFDPVEPRRGAKLLATGTGGRPFLTSWRYGLGRVAAFSGGDKELTEVSRLDPLLLTRTVSWAVGSPKRKQERWLRVENGRRPGEVELQASYRLQGFQREGRNLYTMSMDPGRLGFHSVRNKTYGYNYDPELQQVGYSGDMREVVRATGGEVYRPGDKEEMVEELKSFNEKKVVSKKNLSVHVLVLALLVFMGEVGFRKMNGKK